MTLPYEIIFSRTRGRISDMKELSLDENDLNETWTERLRMVAGDERVIRKFASFNMDDEIQQIEFEMQYPVSDFADKEYVIGLFTLGMTIEWLKPQVDSAKFTARALGTKEEKNILYDASHIEEYICKVDWIHYSMNLVENLQVMDILIIHMCEVNNYGIYIWFVH